MARSRWLMVVRREKAELFENLRETFKGDARIEVILDRRHAGQRAETTDRRRRPPSPRDRDLWESLGFRLIYRDDDVAVYSSRREAARDADE